MPTRSCSRRRRRPRPSASRRPATRATSRPGRRWAARSSPSRSAATPTACRSACWSAAGRAAIARWPALPAPSTRAIDPRRQEPEARRSGRRQPGLAVAFGEMLAIGAMAERLGVEERLDAKVGIVGREQATLDAGLFDTPELRQRGCENRARRRAVGCFTSQRRDGIFILTAGVLRLALAPIVPGRGMRIEPQGSCGAFDGLQWLALHDEEVRPQRIGIGVVGVELQRLVEMRRGFLMLVLVFQHETENGMSPGVTRIETDGAPGKFQRQPAVRIRGLEPVDPAHPMSPGQEGMGFGIVGVERDRPLEQGASLLAFLRRRTLVEEAAAHAEVIGLDVLRRLAVRQLAGGEAADQRLDDAGDDLVLDGEDVGEVAIEPLGPEMAAALARVDQLGVDADAPGGAPRAALEDVADAELVGDAPDVHGAVLEGERGMTGDDEEPGRLRQLSDQVLDQPVGEEAL